MKKKFEKLTLIAFVLFIMVFVKYDGFFINHLGFLFSKFSEFGYFVKKEVNKIGEFFTDHFDTACENKRLKKENDILKTELILARNNSLKEKDFIDTYNLLKDSYSDFDIQNKFVFGFLIKSTSSTFLFIHSQPIEVGDLVFSSNNVVGRVKSTHNGYSKVIAVNHKDFKAKVMGLVTRTDGVLLTDTNGNCILMAKNTDDVFEIGESVVVMGDDSQYFTVCVVKSRISSTINSYSVDLVQEYSSIGIVVKENAVDKS